MRASNWVAHFILLLLNYMSVVLHVIVFFNTFYLWFCNTNLFYMFVYKYTRVCIWFVLMVAGITVVVVVFVVQNLLILWICVAFFQFTLVASLFIDENDRTEDQNFGADTQERPQGGEFALNANK